MFDIKEIVINLYQTMTVMGRLFQGLCYHLHNYNSLINKGARGSFVVRVFTHGAMGHRIDPSWGGCIELFLVPASAPRLV